VRNLLAEQLLAKLVDWLHKLECYALHLATTSKMWTQQPYRLCRTTRICYSSFSLLENLTKMETDENFNGYW